MEKDESWRGEHLIRQKPKSNRSEATRLVNVIYHANRRKAGVPTAGARKHKGFMLTVLRTDNK